MLLIIAAFLENNHTEFPVLVAFGGVWEVAYASIPNFNRRLTNLITHTAGPKLKLVTHFVLLSVQLVFPSLFTAAYRYTIQFSWIRLLVVWLRWKQGSVHSYSMWVYVLEFSTPFQFRCPPSPADYRLTAGWQNVEEESFRYGFWC